MKLTKESSETQSKLLKSTHVFISESKQPKAKDKSAININNNISEGSQIDDIIKSYWKNKNKEVKLDLKSNSDVRSSVDSNSREIDNQNIQYGNFNKNNNKRKHQRDKGETSIKEIDEGNSDINSGIFEESKASFLFKIARNNTVLSSK